VKAIVLLPYWCTRICFWIDIEWYRQIRVQKVLAFLVCEPLPCSFCTKLRLEAYSALTPRCEMQPDNFLPNAKRKQPPHLDITLLASPEDLGI
jgi:hypothetical protein